jgi:hypothetical protein
MDEEKWLACEDPKLMLEYLSRGRSARRKAQRFLRGNGRASDRTLRLFAVAWCRRVWHRLADQRCRDAVEAAERFADGAATQAELSEARSAAWTVYARTGAYYARSVHAAARESCDAAAVAGYAARAARRQREPAAQCVLLRCICGNPFRPVAVSPAWLAWNEGTVVRLAQAAYDERHLPPGTLDNARLAVLADALEEAGCTDGQILGHLRSGGDHVRGCWALDLLLGKS